MDSNGSFFIKVLILIMDIGIVIFNLLSFNRIFSKVSCESSKEMRNRSQQTYIAGDSMDSSSSKMIDRKLNYIYKPGMGKCLPQPTAFRGSHHSTSIPTNPKYSLERTSARDFVCKRDKQSHTCFCDLCKRQLICK